MKFSLASTKLNKDGDIFAHLHPELVRDVFRLGAAMRLGAVRAGNFIFLQSFLINILKYKVFLYTVVLYFIFSLMCDMLLFGKA